MEKIKRKSYKNISQPVIDVLKYFKIEVENMIT